MTRHIAITAQANGSGTVTVDGHDISRGVRRLSLDMQPGNLPVVAVELAVFDVTEVQGPAKLLIPDDTRDALIKLGWTPPEGSS